MLYDMSHIKEDIMNTETDKAIHVAQLAVNYLYVMGMQDQALYKHLEREVAELKAIHKSKELYLLKSGV